MNDFNKFLSTIVKFNFMVIPNYRVAIKFWNAQLKVIVFLCVIQSIKVLYNAFDTVIYFFYYVFNKSVCVKYKLDLDN